MRTGLVEVVPEASPGRWLLRPQGKVGAVSVGEFDFLHAHFAVFFVQPRQRVAALERAEAAGQNTPNTKTQVMGGAMCAMISFNPLKILS